MFHLKVEQIFLEEFNATPSQMFNDFEETPIAAASLAQVHKATTKDGEKVAVKVLNFLRYITEIPRKLLKDKGNLNSPRRSAKLIFQTLAHRPLCVSQSTKCILN